MKIKSNLGYFMWKHYQRGDFLLKPLEHSIEMHSRGYRLVTDPTEELFEDLKTMFSGHELELVKN